MKMLPLGQQEITEQFKTSSEAAMRGVGVPISRMLIQTVGTQLHRGQGDLQPVASGMSQMYS
ncbi:MAG: hypothetical protein CYPHOPRED_006050, partial [Cyphobasidiales sp. Tagirdzhanova-0007]